VKTILENLLQPKTAAELLSAAQAQVKFREGLALHNKGQLAQAHSLYHQALKLRANFFDALHMLGVLAAQTNDPKQAVEWLDKAITVNPNSASAYSNRGNALSTMNLYQAAVQSYDQAIAINPKHANAYANRGLALFELKQTRAAIESYRKAVAVKPEHADAHTNLGTALAALKQHDAAIESYDNAIAINPNHALAHCGRGVELYELGRNEAAIESFDKAIFLDSDFADAYSNRGAALNELKQYQSAVHSYNRAIAIQPAYDFLFGRRLHTKMRICDWSDSANQISELVERILRKQLASPPFAVLSLSDSLPAQQKSAQAWVNEKYPANAELGNIIKRSREKRIRLGYFSADYHNHATAYLMAELFERHDRSLFELFAFSFGPDSKDEMRQRICAAFDHFADVSHQSDKEIARLSRNLNIDIAIDLKGFTQDHRTGIFAYRAAPLQVNYLGYPGTMGADYIDYLIADRVLIPEENQQHYSEKIAYLPNSYQVNDSQRKVADKVFTREELGLPESGFVFCCFNSNYKITPNTFHGWMRILKQVAGSVLWLFEDNAMAASHLRKEARNRGVIPERLVFAERLPLPEHLARHRAADLCIDTLPYNAHTTASDALWAGLPVVTCTGEAFAGRVAASLLTAIDLPELITSTQEEYETLAVELATNPDRLRSIKQKLERNRLSTPLFDSKLFTRHIEDAYKQMFERYHADLAPDHIYVGKR
jgi:predicted O-linked N-acetylglucosamine transferase (SPINDLY family)